MKKYNSVKTTSGHCLFFEGELKKISLLDWAEFHKKTYFSGGMSLEHPFLVFYKESLHGDFFALGSITKDMFDQVRKHPMCEDNGSTRSIDLSIMKKILIKEKMKNAFSNI